MSASEAADGSSPVLCPSFAVICSFLERYGALLDLPEVSFPALERGLLESGTVPKVLVDLHVKLLRKICKSVTADRWEKYLVKICQELNSTWAWELENKGYREMTVECKTEILKYLCECQFDDNVKFKTAINEEDPDKMRLQPIGKDKDGLMYWFQLDLHHNVRVYVEEQDDLDGSSWKCVVRNRDDLAQILGLLKTQIDPALLVKKDQEEGTNPNPDDENTKKDGAEASVEESKDDLSSENKENLTEKENIMQEDADATSNLKMKEEPQKDSETTKSTSVIITSIKEEPKDEEEKVKEKESSTTSTEQMEDVKRKALEEAQRALKIDHQAKMPLKKREMKLTDNFDSNFAGLRNVPIKETRMSSEENRSSVEKINGHVPHLQKETENKSENLPHADRVKDICVEQKVSSETRLCATEHIEVEKTLGEGKPENTLNSASCEVAKENISAQSSESNKDIPNLDREEVSVQEVSVIASAKSLPKDDAAKVVVIKQTPKDIKSEETNKGVSKEDTPNQESRKCLLNNDLIKDSPVKESSSECSVKDPPREEAREDVPNVESRKVEEQVIVVKKSSTSEELLSDGPNKDSKQGLIQDSLKEPSKHSSNQDSLKDSLPPKDLPKEQAMGDVSKEKSMKNFPNAEPIKERVEKESPKAVDGESPKSDKDSSSVDKKLGPEPEEAEQSKSEEDASRGETKALPATERPNVIKDIKSLRTSTENVFQAEKHCESEQEKLPSSEEKGSVVSNLGDESDSHQNKDQRDSENNDISETSTKETVADGSEKPVESSISEKSESDPVSGDGNKEMQMEVDAEVSKSGMNLSKTKEKEDDGSGGQSKDSEKEQPEVSSEVQEMSDNTMKASGRRPGRPSNKFKKAAHRRKAELQREEEKRDSDSEPSDGRCLRRSARISRPSAKAVETQDRKVERKQPSPVKEREKEEEEEEEKQQEEEEEPVQRKPRKVEGDGQPKPKVGRRRKRQLWSRMKRKKKSSDDEEDEESESEEEETEVDDSDEDYKVEKTKRRRRNRHRERRSSDSSTSSSENDEPNDDPCKHCGLPNHPELILLCDSCDNGYHTACLRPPLMIIPDGEWFCPPCQHKLLCDRLEEQLVNLDAALKKKERAERRKERLVYVGISLENIITPSVEVEEEKEEVVKEKVHVKKSKSWGRRSTRAKKYISYRFDEFDEAIEEAIEEDIKEAEGGGAGRGKDMANITGHRGKDMSTILQEEGKENGRPKKTSSVQKKKRRRLNDLDSDSTVDEEESEDEFRLSNSSEEEEFVVSDNDAESEEDAPSFEGSDFDSDAGRQRVKANRFKINRRRQPPRRRRRPRGYSDEEEMESDEEEEEEEMVTEGSSEFSDSDLDVRCRRSYRSQKQMVNYCETSDTEASQASTNKDKKKKRRRLSSSDSEVNFQSADSEEDERKPKKMRVDSSEEESKKQRRRLSLKRRRESEDDDDDDDSDDSEEEDRPIRKRVNRIDSDDSESEEEEVKKKPKETEEKSAATGPLEHNSAEPPPTNGQNPVKATEGIVPRPKNSTTIASNGLENAAQEEDEDDLLGVTDLVDYVCNSEQL